jgi:hypothetical protein
VGNGDGEARAADTTDGRREGSGLPEWARNLRLGALSVGAASTVLVALRLLSVAKFNLETAYGILQATGTGNVVMGTVISVIPSIAIGVALCLAFYMILQGSGSIGVEFALVVTMVALILIALLTTPVKYYAVIGACVVVVFAVWLIREKIRGVGWDTGAGRGFLRFFASVLAILLVFGVVISPPWMPAESLTLNNKQVTGYILTQTPNGLTVLQANPREIIYYGPNALTNQYMCSDSPSWDFSVIFFMPRALNVSNVFNSARYYHC